MRPAVIAAAVAVLTALPALASALEIERHAQAVGERPSSFLERDIGASTWIPRALPETRFAERSPQSGLSAGGAESSFRLKEVAGELREGTRSLLTELRARESDGDILISLPGDVLFDFDKSDIRADARPVLDKLAKLLGSYPDAPVRIEGHTDSKGDDDYNQALSDRRARSVRDYLSGEHVDDERMSTHGFGESRPVAQNEKPDGTDDPEGRQLNRRVEFVIGRPRG